MTGGLLDFFTLEASEYVEQLDTLVSQASDAPPPPDAFARALRALRGSATMAKVDGVAALATAMERLAKQVREGRLAWDTETRGVAIAALEEVQAKDQVEALIKCLDDERWRVRAKRSACSITLR